jgi:acyl carrier protein
MLKKQLADVAALAAQLTNSAPSAATNPTTTRPNPVLDFDAAFRQVVLEIADADPMDYDPSADLREDLALDSLDLIEMIMVCEKEFRVLIPDREWMTIKTVGELYALVKRHLSQGQAKSACAEVAAPASGLATS